MENEFWITTELLSFGGNLDLLIIPYKRQYLVILDDLELCTIRKNSQGLWVEMVGDMGPAITEAIGSAIELYYYTKKSSLKEAC